MGEGDAQTEEKGKQYMQNKKSMEITSMCTKPFPSNVHRLTEEETFPKDVIRSPATK